MIVSTEKILIFYILVNFTLIVTGTVYFHKKDAVVNWVAPIDNWDLKKAPRSTVSHLELKEFPDRQPNQPADSDDEFLAHLQTLLEGQSNGEKFNEFFDKIFNFKELAYGIENSVLPCTACKTGAGLLMHNIKNGKSDDEIIDLIAKYCTGLNIQRPRVCTGIASIFGRDMIYVLKRADTNPNEICSFLLGEQCGDEFSRYHEWEVELPPVPKPPVVPDLPIPKGAHFFKVLQLSDTHYDPHYETGSNADCNEPLCCRSTNGKPTTQAAAAGKWGDFRKCDTPKRTVDHMLAHIAETHKDIDYILWTGDLPPHDIWNQSKVLNLEIINETVRQMNEHFPNVPIFPALGNHESAPVNSFPPPYIKEQDMSISWLYDTLDELWQKWLPQTVSQTVRRGAFYSVLVRPGFRIISLNMNYCNNKNWWLLLNTTDPATELDWFIYELQTAEMMNEKVHVIGHIPPGNADCLKVWSRNFYKIITRYESTITAQFYGHTHYDEFEIFYDPKNLTRPTNIAYIAPSVSPYDNLNPGYRIYYVDGEHEATTHTVINHETWIMDLQEANLNDNPIWYKLYTARAAYNMTALRPIDWHLFINKMLTQRNIFDLYYRNYWKDSPVRPACDNECRKRLLCDARSGRTHDRKDLCADIMSNSLLYHGLEETFQAVSSAADFASSVIIKLKGK